MGYIGRIIAVAVMAAVVLAALIAVGNGYAPSPAESKPSETSAAAPTVRWITPAEANRPKWLDSTGRTAPRYWPDAEQPYVRGGVAMDTSKSGALPGAALALLRTYFEWREQDFAAVSGLPDEIAAPAVSDQVALQREQRLIGLKAMLRRWDCVLAGSYSDVRIDDVSYINGVWTVCVYEFSWFANWYTRYTTPATADISGAGTWHVIRMVGDATGWTVTGDACEDACTGVQSPHLNDDAVFVAYIGPVSEGKRKVVDGDPPLLTSDTPTYCTDYDPQAAVAYCRQWIIPRNPAYHDYSVPDGNCANLASQSLLAGGLPTDDIWYPGSPTFISSTRLWRYLTETARVGKGVAVIRQADEAGRTLSGDGNILPARDLIKIGNPVLYRWGGGFVGDGTWRHTALCTGYLGDGTPAITCDTTDRVNYKWNFGGATTDYGTVWLTDPAKSDSGQHYHADTGTVR